MTRRTAEDVPQPMPPNLLDGSWTLRLFLQRWGISPWNLALLGWTAYYLVPMAATIVYGAFFPPDVDKNSHLQLVFSTPVIHWLSRSGVTKLPYAKDLTHFLMASIAIFLGGSFVFQAVLKFQDVFKFVIQSDQIQAPESAIASQIAQLRRRLRNRIVRWTILAAALLLAGVMYSKTRTPGLEYWWGHSSHGPAGALFSVACAFALYFGGVSLWLLTAGLSSISAIFEHPILLRPFHPDGCNGLQRVGNYIMFLFCLCFTMATAIWITLHFGYLQIEDFFITWIVALSAILVVPLILIKPLLRITKQVRTARFEKLSAIDQRLRVLLAEFEQHLSNARDAVLWRKSLSELLEARRAMNDVYSTNIFPFSPRVAGALSISYMVQGVLFVRELLGQLH